MGLLIGAIGCGPAIGPDDDPNQAVTVLRTALDAWKNGASAESLQNQRPPIWFNEPESKQSRLVDYQLDSKTSMVGRQVRCTVSLTLATSSGKKVERNVPYLVDTTPNQVIVREQD
jgi:hypothetical protein